MLGFLTYYAYKTKNRPRPPMTNKSFILKTRLRAVSLLLWNPTATNAKKSGRDRRAVSGQAAISFCCDWRPAAGRSRPLFPRSFQSDFTAKEIARSLFEKKNLCLKLKNTNCTNIALRSQELSRFGGGGYSRKFWISVCLEESWTLSHFKDETNENCPNTKYDTLFKEKQ